MRHLTRGNPFLREKRHDPYRAREKKRESTHCPQCGAVLRNGRWIWPRTATSGYRSEICPACRRIGDDYPAGELVLSGSFLAGHRKEILATVRRVNERERNEHPLHRIMAIDEQGPDIVITTTDIHLPHRIAHALMDAWDGSMSTHYDLGGYFARAGWKRDS